MRLKKFIQQFRNDLSYCRTFGRGGISYLYQKKFHPRKVIEFSIPGVPHPIKLRNGTSDLNVFRQVFYRKDYNLKFQYEPQTIIDLGANIGLGSIYFKSRFPNATIIAVEPDPGNYQMMLENTRHYTGIHCVNAGVWNRKAILEIRDPGLGEWGYMLHEVEQANDHTVNAVSISDLITQFNLTQIDLLKVDIEGSEKELFSSHYENWLPRVKMLIIDCAIICVRAAARLFSKPCPTTISGSILTAKIWFACSMTRT